jgi:amino acid adenylation domain-containing protein
VHDLVMDRACIQRVLLPELIALYAAFAAGRPSPLPPLAVQYADFARWQRSRGAAPEAVAYWRRRLSGAPILALPTDHARPPAMSFEGARHRLTLPESVTSAVRELASRTRTSVFLVLLTVFQALLHRLTGQDDVVVGTTSAGPTRPETDPLLGLFASPLALRADLSGDVSFLALLDRTREAMGEDLAHADIPFETVVSEVPFERDASRNPFFEVVFALDEVRTAWPSGWQVDRLDVDPNAATFDLALELDEHADTIAGHIEYRTALFEAGTIARLADRYVRVIEAVTSQPELRLSELPVLDVIERARILEWGRPYAPYPDTATTHGAFALQAARAPEAIALIEGERRITYAELDRQADRIAAVLRRHGVGRGSVVGVWLPRSADFAIAVLGVLKAHAAYLPLDPAQPRPRLRAMLDDAGVDVLLARAPIDLGADGRALDVVMLDAAPTGPEPQPARAAAGPDDLAYVMFTSGSTGRPKGVAVPHSGILRLLFGQSYARFDATRAVLFASAVTFDLSTLELWGALLHGGRCVILPAGTPTSHALAEVIARHGVTTVWLTASLFNALIDEAPATLNGVEEVLAGGEALSVAHVRRAFERLPGVVIINGYGPTECTTFACCHRMHEPPPAGASSVPIGPPIANTEAYVLDGRGHLAPIGVVGELYLGGPGLARGYVNRPGITAERFVPHPFDPAPDARLYRTGDLARWREDGLLEFFGRNDTQVKIRGIRIELGEIEVVLTQHPDVREAVVVARQSAAQTREIIAYLVLRAGARPPDLAAFLRDRLPAYMVPAAFVIVPAIPVTAHGKADHLALAALGAGTTTRPAPDRLPARDPLEAWLVGLWEELLGVRPVGVRDDFFALGGHSLAAVRMVHRIEQHLGERLPLATLYAHSTVESLGRALLNADRTRFLTPVLELQPEGTGRPFFFFHGDVNGGGFYCRDLARHLGADQPLFAIHPLGLDDRPVPTTIEAMAAEHLPAIRARQPHGPYVLGGYCNGGLTAYEVACALARAGETVELVVLVAAPADARLRRLRLMLDRVAWRLGLDEAETALYFGRFRHWADRWRTSSGRNRIGLTLTLLTTAMRELAERARGVRRSPFSRVPIAPDAGTALRVADGLLREDTYARYFAAVKAYVPPVFPGRLLVLWPAGCNTHPADEAALGWKKLARYVEVVMMPGDHDTIVTHHTELIARAIHAARDATG